MNRPPAHDRLLTVPNLLSGLRLALIPVFIYLLQTLYRTFLGVPEAAVHELLKQHGLPSYTMLPEPHLESQFESGPLSIAA